MKIFLVAMAACHALSATDAQWISTSNTDLNTPINWTGDAVPTGIASFDSQYPSVIKAPVATSLFTIDNIDFVNSAQDFTFTLTGPGSLQFTGIGISGTNTNTSIQAANTSTMSNAQIYFNPSVSTTSASLGNTGLFTENSPVGTITFNNAAQISFADSDSYLVVPITAGDDVSIQTNNNGSLNGANEAGQVFLKGSSFTVGNNFSFTAENAALGSIASNSDTGQIVFDAGHQTASWTAGDNANFLLVNGYFNSTNTIASTGNNAGQIVFDGSYGEAAFTLGNNAVVTLANNYGSSISNTSSGNDAGQMVLDGDTGTASFSAGDNAAINISNLTNSFIHGLGFDTGQIVVDGDGGTASFTVGKSATIILTSASSASNTILSGSDGNDAGQIVIDGNNGIASFTTGDNATLNLSNAGGSTIVSLSSSAGHDAGQIVIDGNKNNMASPDGAASLTLGNNANLYVINAAGCTITSSFNTGQVVVDGNNGTASMVLGNNDVINIVNNGAITNIVTGSIAAQIVFNGSTSFEGSVSLETGTNTFITATLDTDGSISNAGTSPAAQIYFSSASVYGNPTITAINLSGSAVEGIVFDGTSTATGANIALQYSSLLIDTTAHPLFTIGSLSGDFASLVKLNQDFEITTASGVTTTFAGVILDDSGVNNLTISGSGTQVLSGINTYAGNTTVNGGTLLLTGSVANNVIVNSNAALSGTGTINGSLIVNSNGEVNPGLNSQLGTLYVNQNYTQASGGVFYAEISGTLSPLGTPESNLLNVAETATLAGTLDVVSVDGTYCIGRPYTILTAGTLNGTFDHVAALNPFLNVNVLYNPDPTVQIILSTDFITSAETNNQKNVATQIDGIAVPVGNEETVINNLLALTAKQLPKALDEMAGEQYSYLVEINQFSDSRFGRRIFDAVRQSLDPCACECGDRGINTWSSFEAEYGRMDNTKNSRGYKQTSLDLSFGLDTTCNGLLYGAAMNLESNRISFNLKGTNTLQNIQGAIYGAYTGSKFYLFSDLMIGQGRSHFKRPIQFAELDQTAHSNPTFTHSLGYAEAGLNFYECGLLIQPFLGADCSYVNAHAIQEHHAESLNLKVDGRSVWAENIYLGAHFTSCCDCFEFNADLIYQYRCGSLGTTLNTRFIEFGNAFQIDGGQYSRSGFIGNINAVADLMGLADVYVEFTAELWNHRPTYAGSIGLSRRW